MIVVQCRVKWSAIERNSLSAVYSPQGNYKVIKGSMKLKSNFCFSACYCFAHGKAKDAATITVTNTNDSGPGSLRQALANANNGDRINFAVTGTIALTSGGLGITKNVTISGPGANQLAVDGNQALFVFGVFPQKTVTISGLLIRNAQVGVYNNQGTVTVSNCA